MAVKPFKKQGWIFLLLLLIWCISLTTPLQGIHLGDFNFYFTEEFTYKQNKLANRENQYYNILSLFANYRNLSFKMSLRGHNFFKQEANTSFDEMQYDIYEKQLNYQSKSLKISVGDFNSMLGRGLVLSILKNSDIFQEKSILGGNIRLDLKNNVQINLLGGEVKSDLEDQVWHVYGGEIGWDYLTHHRIGLHFSRIDDVDSWRNLGRRHTFSFSLKGDKLFKYLNYYVEAASLTFDNKNHENGYGVFAKLGYHMNRISIFSEYKKYEDFNNELNNPPVADRSDEYVVLGDSEGFRIFFEYAFPEPDISFHLNIGWNREYSESGLHLYGGIGLEEMMDWLTLNLSYGVRDVIYPIRKTDLDGSFLLSDTLSLDFYFKDKRYTDKSFQFTEQDLQVQLNFVPKLSVHFLYQFSHNRIQNLNHFYSGGIHFNLSDSISFKLEGGTIRGGQVCSGGQCFVIPPFKGLRFSCLMTFI